MTPPRRLGGAVALLLPPTSPSARQKLVFSRVQWFAGTPTFG